MKEENPFINYIESLTEANFYGKLEVSFENGKITHMKKVESIHPKTLTVTINTTK